MRQAEKHLRIHMLNLEVDWLQQQKTKFGSTPVRYEQKAEAAVDTHTGQLKSRKAWCDECPFLLRDANGKVRVLQQQHGLCPVATVQTIQEVGEMVFTNCC